MGTPHAGSVPPTTPAWHPLVHPHPPASLHHSRLDREAREEAEAVIIRPGRGLTGALAFSCRTSAL